MWRAYLVTHHPRISRRHAAIDPQARRSAAADITLIREFSEILTICYQEQIDLIKEKPKNADVTDWGRLEEPMVRFFGQIVGICFHIRRPDGW